MYQDKVLSCRDCGSEFVWTAGEQEFYASKGLQNSPSRCPSCRAAARAARQSGSAAGRPRELFPVVCDKCGVQTQVPFLPRHDRPVYCSTCFDTVRMEGSGLEQASS
ncbi:MAG: zinc-ribbon domain containing protein [Chloroflexota bacterium]